MPKKLKRNKIFEIMGKSVSLKKLAGFFYICSVEGIFRVVLKKRIGCKHEPTVCCRLRTVEENSEFAVRMDFFRDNLIREYPRRESNPNLAFRKRLFYPLNYKGGFYNGSCHLEWHCKCTEIIRYPNTFA